MKSTLLLIVGIGAGWLAFSLLTTDSDIPDQASGLVVNDTDPPLHTPAPQTLQQNSQQAAISRDNPTSLLSDIELLLRNHEYQQAALTCDTSTDSIDRCRVLFSNYAKSSGSLAQRIGVLEAWAAVYQDDVESSFQLIDALVDDRRHGRGIEVLTNLKNNQFDPYLLSHIATYAAEMVRSHKFLFVTNSDPDSLAALYDILIESDAQNPQWRFEYAELLSSMDKKQKATELLSYILYDAEYGDRATALHQQIQRESQQSPALAVPLVEFGSQYLIDAVINGTTPATLLIDTGASITVVREALLLQAGVSFAANNSASLQTAGGVTDAAIVELGSLQIGEVVLSNVETASIDSLGARIDGLLGMDVLGQYHFSIDQDKRVLFLGRK